ncbi:PREDICTED: uncharacterized protein LOC106146735 [Chinchilla lanigera]|uniref:uncharacterized protein LOC106146735 n=1 Tax=Chinchilla lanigera TaxID=34839 RepID=UPI000698F07E|nr:PREDICTED: uncharacterized protein LOC106146735 [Chinchilla lanigera]
MDKLRGRTNPGSGGSADATLVPLCTPGRRRAAALGPAPNDARGHEVPERVRPALRHEAAPEAGPHPAIWDPGRVSAGRQHQARDAAPSAGRVTPMELQVDVRAGRPWALLRPRPLTRAGHALPAGAGASLPRAVGPRHAEPEDFQPLPLAIARMVSALVLSGFLLIMARLWMRCHPSLSKVLGCTVQYSRDRQWARCFPTWTCTVWTKMREIQT